MLRVPWIASSARRQFEDEDRQLFGAAQEMDYNYYEYGDASEVDYGAIEDELYDVSAYQYDEDELGEYEYEYDADDSGTKHEMVKDYAVYSDVAVNALGNGDDFLGNAASVTDEVWKFETVLLVIFVSVLLCLVTSCFLWRSKWGELIRRLNQQRIERNNRLCQAKRMNELMTGDEDSSSLNISDVSPIHYD